MASEQGLDVDAEGFRRLMADQKARAKADAKSKKAGAQAVEVYRELRAAGVTPFTGLQRAGDRVERARHRARRRAGRGRRPRATWSRSCWSRPRSTPSPAARTPTPGRITGDGVELEVLDVQRPVKGLVVHRVRVTRGELQSGTDVLAQVDGEWRLGACQAHSGTHVMHAALRQVLGPTALQSGSYNKPGYLRLDFAWQGGLSQATRSDVEEAANRAHPRRPRRVGDVHAAGDRARDRCAGAVRRDLRRGGPRRRDGRAVVARAVRWHARAALLADRPGHPDDGVVGRFRGPPRRGVRRHRGVPLPGGRAHPGARADRDAQGAARPADGPGPDGSSRSSRTPSARSPTCGAGRSWPRPAASPRAGTRCGAWTTSATPRRGVAGNDLRSLALEVRNRVSDRPAVVAVVGGTPDKPSVVVVDHRGRPRTVGSRPATSSAWPARPSAAAAAASPTSPRAAARTAAGPATPSPPSSTRSATSCNPDGPRSARARPGL